MPCLPIDYSNTVIYKILCNDLSIADCYVGQTTASTRRKIKNYHCRYEFEKSLYKDNHCKWFTKIRFEFFVICMHHDFISVWQLSNSTIDQLYHSPLNIPSRK